MKGKFFFLVSAICLNSCNFILGVKDLGEGYFYDPPLMLYTENKSYNGTGSLVVPGEILSYNSDEDFVIATSKVGYHPIQYWIILKKEEKKQLQYTDGISEMNSEFVLGYSQYYVYSNIKGPMDEAEFKAAEKMYNVPNNLVLKEVR